MSDNFFPINNKGFSLAVGVSCLNSTSGPKEDCLWGKLICQVNTAAELIKKKGNFLLQTLKSKTLIIYRDSWDEGGKLELSLMFSRAVGRETCEREDRVREREFASYSFALPHSEMIDCHLLLNRRRDTL